MTASAKEVGEPGGRKLRRLRWFRPPAQVGQATQKQMPINDMDMNEKFVDEKENRT